MAPHDVTLRAELKYRDGRKRRVDVRAQSDLSSVITAVKTLRGMVSDLLTELTEQEKGSAPGHQGELGSHDEDEDDDEDLETPKVAEPPAKKSKPVKK